MGWGAPTAANAGREAQYYAGLTNRDRAGMAAIGVGAAAGGFAIMTGTGSMMAAGALRAVSIVTAGGGLTGKIVDALENSGPAMGARVNAVLGQVPRSLKALMTTNAETGAVTIRGGVGSRAREIILNTDGSSVVRAFDAGKNVWNTVKEIKPQ